MLTSSVVLKVNDAGEKAIFFFEPSNPTGYLRIYRVNHFPVQHERAAFPKKFVSEDGDIYLCDCGLRILIPPFVKSRKDLLKLFQKFNKSGEIPIKK